MASPTLQELIDQIKAQNVSQFGPIDSTVNSYKEAAEYAAEAKDWTDLCEQIYLSLKDANLEDIIQAVTDAKNSAAAAATSASEAAATEVRVQESVATIDGWIKDMSITPFPYTGAGGETSIILPEGFKEVQVIYLNGGRQERGDDFLYDLNTRTITLMNPLFLNDRVTVLSSTIYEQTSTLAQTLSGLGGADYVKTGSGESVQNNLNDIMSTIDFIVNVDDFGADPTGVSDSSDSVLLAIKSISNVSDSSYDQSSTHYAKIVFGRGTYRISNIPLMTGFVYQGQGQFSTRLIPSEGADWVFTTTGTTNVDQSSSDLRMFNSSVRDMTIGSYFVFSTHENAEPITKNAGGILLKSCSYVNISNVCFNGLEREAIKCVEVFDSNFYDIRMRYCGSSNGTTIYPALYLGPDGFEIRGGKGLSTATSGSAISPGGKVVVQNSSAFSLVLPDASLFTAGREVHFIVTGVSPITITSAQSGGTVNGSSSIIITPTYGFSEMTATYAGGGLWYVTR